MPRSTRRFAGFVLPAILVAAVLVAAALLARSEREEGKREESVLASQAAIVLERNVAQLVGELRGVSSIAAGGTIDVRAFAAFSEGVLEDPLVIAVGLEQVVSDSERAAFERSTRPILEPVGTNELGPAAKRAEYFPIIAVAPSTEPNRALLGFDIGSDPVRGSAARDARNAGEPRLTAPLTLTAGELGFAVVAPLTPLASQGEARSGAVGFVTAAFRSADLVEQALRQLPRGTDLTIMDGRTRIHPSAGDGSPEGAQLGIPVGGRQWMITVADPTGPEYLAPIILLACGLAVAGLTGLYLLLGSRREAALEQAREVEAVARRRAQVLERHAADLAAAVTVGEVAEATVAELEGAGFPLVGVFTVRDRVIDVLAARGISDDTLERVRGQPLEGGFAVAEAIRTGETVEAVSGEEYDARYPGFVEVRRSYPLETLIAIPLRATGGRTVGALFAGSSVERWIDDNRRQLLTGVAEQTGSALERAQLHAQAEAAAADNSLLSLLSDSLERVMTIDERSHRLVAVLTSTRADFAAVHLLDEHGRRALVAAGGEPQSGADRPAPRVLRLHARGRALGDLTIETSRPLDDALGREIAARAAISLDNALLYEREREVSRRLQLGLLGGALPRVEGVALAPAYRPGTAALEVGGDWYDAFSLPSGSLVLVVGDVVGHGLEAAVTMGQLRGAVRALAPTGSPARVLERLDVFVDSLPAASMATLAYIELEPSSGRFRYACAGHPPPLLVRTGGRTRFLWDGRSVPLGSVLEERRSEAAGNIEADEALVLYTDGLVERRNESLEVGLGRLARAARAHGAGAKSLVEYLCAALLEAPELDDDVCVLAAQRLSTPDTFVHSFPASPSQLADLRQKLGSWLTAVGVDHETERNTVLAVSEAAANAIEHAYGFDGIRGVTVAARLDADGELHVSVGDEGEWREPDDNSDRGRGIPIMQAVMDEVVFDRQAGGTVVRMRRPAKPLCAVSGHRSRRERGAPPEEAS